MAVHRSHTSTRNPEDAYRGFGIEPIAEGEETSREILLHLLQKAEHNFKNVACGLVPTSFDPHDPLLTAFPRPLQWKWPALQRYLQTLQSASVMMLLPQFWQMQSCIHRECHDVAALLFIADIANTPIAAAATESLSIDTVITSTQDCSELLDYLSEKEMPAPRSWVFVHDANKPTPHIPENLRETHSVVQEIHIFPCVPIFEQCGSLIQRHSNRFHTSEAYVWEFKDDRTLITSAREDPLPLLKYRLPFTAIQTDMCPCGKVEVEYHHE